MQRTIVCCPFVSVGNAGFLGGGHLCGYEPYTLRDHVCLEPTK